ncbi:cytidylyltransferase [Escherichia coli]|nr:cytidylyltransferase [Escherichia coli]
MKNTVPTSQRLISRRIIWDIDTPDDFITAKERYTEI